MRALPIAVLRPVAGAAEAISYALLGEKEGLRGRRRRREEEGEAEGMLRLSENTEIWMFIFI